MKIAVIGIGQSLRGDDAAGLEAVRRWQEKYPETASRFEVRVEASEMPGLTLLDLIDGAEAAILVDAVRSHAPAGTVYSIYPNELEAFTSASQSAHGWSVAETLALAKELNLPVRRIQVRIVGIEVGQVEVGSGLSEAVAEQIPAACDTIEREVLALLNR